MFPLAETATDTHATLFLFFFVFPCSSSTSTRGRRINVDSLSTVPMQIDRGRLRHSSSWICHDETLLQQLSNLVYKPCTRMSVLSKKGEKKRSKVVFMILWENALSHKSTGPRVNTKRVGPMGALQQVAFVREYEHTNRRPGYQHHLFAFCSFHLFLLLFFPLLPLFLSLSSPVSQHPLKSQQRAVSFTG